MPHRSGQTGARRRALLLAGALAAGSLSIPLAAHPAAAVTGTVDRQVLLVQDSRGVSLIVSRPVGAPDALEDVILAPATSRLDYNDLSVSADGSRFTYVTRTYPVTGPTQEQVVIRDVSGNLVRVADSASSSTAYLFSPALSPDGSTVVWGRDSMSGTTLRKAAVAGGAPVSVPGAPAGFDYPAFLSPSTLVLIDRLGDARTLSVTGGTAGALVGISGKGPSQFEVNQAGTKIAWALETTPANSTVTTYDVYVGDLTAVSGVFNVTGAKPGSTVLSL